MKNIPEVEWIILLTTCITKLHRYHRVIQLFYYFHQIFRKFNPPPSLITLSFITFTRVSSRTLNLIMRQREKEWDASVWYGLLAHHEHCHLNLISTFLCSLFYLCKKLKRTYFLFGLFGISYQQFEKDFILSFQFFHQG